MGDKQFEIVETYHESKRVGYWVLVLKNGAGEVLGWAMSAVLKTARQEIQNKIDELRREQ